LLTISSEVMSSAKEELKQGQEEVRNRKINRPISSGKGKLSRERSVERLISFQGLSGENKLHLWKLFKNERSLIESGGKIQ